MGVRGSGEADGALKRRASLIAATGLAALCSAAVATAQDPPPDPYATGEQAVAENGLPDTDLTPQPKDSNLWRQWGGAKFPDSEADDGTELVLDSVTSFDTDLFTVAFRNVKLGFAGGSACAEPPEREEGESDAAYGERVADCERVPALFQFMEIPGEGRVWSKVDLPGDGSPGFIGAIAWMGPGRALAVGGDGEFPRREPAYGRDVDGEPCEPPPEDEVGTPAEPYGANCDQAGMARAWLYDHGEWRDLSSELPEGMRGLSALDFYPGDLELGFAGGLGQIWTWRDGQFGAKVDNTSPPGDLGDTTTSDEGESTPGGTGMFGGASRFVFRVREIEFARNEAIQAFAVTAGCCSSNRARDLPQLMSYATRSLGTPKPGKPPPAPQWFTRSYGWDPTLGASPANYRQDAPDSFYGIQVTPAQGGEPMGFPISVLGTPGGPRASSEPPSALSAPTCRGTKGGTQTNTDTLELAEPVIFAGEAGKPLDPASHALRATISTMRLHSADGDVWNSDRPSATHYAFGPPLGLAKCAAGSPRDGIADWAVGELRSTGRAGLGTRGLAFGTAVPPDTGDTVDSTPDESELVTGTYRPTTEEKAKAYLAARAYRLPSYTLNSLDVVGDTDSGWAVGDRGAIMELAQRTDPSASLEPEPPRLGTRRPQSIAEPVAPPLAASGHVPGPVPALDAQPMIQLDEPVFQPGGSPDPTRTLQSVEDVAEIVMSRDGTEGWAIGPSGQVTATGATTLYHYTGGVWSRCDMIGIEGQRPPDRECEALAPLRRFTNQIGSFESVRLVAAARVPLENDTDPSNDDEFEVVAIGTNYKPSPAEAQEATVLRYRDGRWQLEDPSVRAAVLTGGFNTEVRDIAFTSPDDGWILSGKNDGGYTLFHFDGQRWSDCGLSGGCDDPDGVLPFGKPSVGTDFPNPVGLAAAGDRVYVYGTRGQFPLIAYHDASEGRWVSDAARGGFDPGRGKTGGVGAPDPELKSQQGRILSLAVAERPDGTTEGWALGRVGPLVMNVSGADPDFSEAVRETFLLRLSQEGTWEHQELTGPLADYLSGAQPKTEGPLQAIVPTSESASVSFIAQAQTGRIFRAGSDGDWSQVDGGRPPDSAQLDARVQALAPDGQGGLWAAFRNTDEGFWGLPGSSQVYFFHYSDRAPRPVFEETSQPVSTRGARITALSGTPDGTVWATTDSSTLARYDRANGWETLRVPGWDPGRVVTRASRATAIALNESGAGVVVGEGGRIAGIEPGGAHLDSAAGKTACSTSNAPPCGTGRDLTAAAIAPDGSALVGGERMTLLWRPAAGQFSAVPRPGSSADVTGISMPRSDRAYVTTPTGVVYRGDMSGAGGWTWEVENLNSEGDPLTLDETGSALPLRGISVDAQGNGYAVGDRGVILRRTGDGQHPWRRLRTSFLDQLRTVTLAPGGAGEALIGGDNGLILTGRGDRFDVARHADYFAEYNPAAGGDGQITGPVVGLVVMPGAEPGQAEAWAAIQGRGSGDDRMLHYASHSDEPLLDPGRGVEPLPDVPPVREGDLSFAAFGKTDCPALENFCQEMTGSTALYESLAREVVDDLEDRQGRPGGPAFSVFTGDAVDAPDYPGGGTSEQVPTGSGVVRSLVPPLSDRGPRKFRRWAEFVADPLDAAGMPLFGAIGGQDLSAVLLYNPVSADPIYNTKQDVKAGDNLDWRQVMMERPAPWGGGELPEGERYEFSAVPDSASAERSEDVEVDPDGDGAVRGKRLALGGASTHYAVDVTDRGSGERVARIIVLDNSLRSLQSSDPVQQPFERGGELVWLDQMLCREGAGAGGEPCTREEDQRAIVVANTPTYSYGPGVITHTATDFGTLESILFRHQANVVVSGRLGWNGLYWATAPGVHVPCPGEVHPSEPPEPGTRVCGQGAAASEQPPDPQAVVNELSGSDLSVTGLIPFVVASGAGGKFGPDGRAQGSAAEGYWHGYSMVRLSADGDPRKTVVEQRPLLDWLALSAPRHAVRPGKKLALTGVGREPLGIGEFGTTLTTRFDEISTPAITHRYELLEADPNQPWLPKRDAGSSDDATEHRSAASARLQEGDPCGPYVCLDPKVGTVDQWSGEVKAGSGKYPRTHAVAQLSVGDQQATYPLVFEPRASFKPPRPAVPPPVALPPVNTPPNAVQPTAPAVNLPPPPVLPVLTAPTPAPPPAPPVPPVVSSQSPIDLSLSATTLDVQAPSAVSQPPTPPVNPAPPSGARREARQRQAAAQKSGADADEASETQELGGDPVDAGPDRMTRLEYGRRTPDPAGSPMPLASREQPSAWARDALIGGGLGLAALVLALGLRGVRPTPRRREPELPALARGELHRRR